MMEMKQTVPNNRDGEMGTLKTDIFIARAECKWYTGEKTLPHNIGQISKRRVNKILKSEGKNSALNRRFMENISQIMIEPHEVELDKEKIKEETTSNGKTHQVFEGELFFIIKVPSTLKMSPDELLENVNVLLGVNSKYSSTKLEAIKYLGTNTY